MDTGQIIALGAVLVLAAMVWRWWFIRLYPVGVAYGFESPDGKFEASAVTMFGKRFLGPSYTWTKLDVADTISHETLFTRHFRHLKGCLDSENRNDDIKWSTDSTQVEYWYEGEVICVVMTKELLQLPHAGDAAIAPPPDA